MPEIINANTFIGRPAIAGMLYSAPVGTAYPTDATTALPAVWAQLGAISEDGITRTGAPEVESIVDAGGRNIRNSVTDHPLEYTLTFLEALNLEVLRELNGVENVVVSADGLTITLSLVEGYISPARVYVIVLEDYPNRKIEIIKLAQVIVTGEVTYSKALPGVVYEARLAVLSPGDGTNIRVTEITQLNAMLPSAAAAVAAK